MRTVLLTNNDLRASARRSLDRPPLGFTMHPRVAVELFAANAKCLERLEYTNRIASGECTAEDVP